MQRVADVKPSSVSQPVNESTFADLLRPLVDPGFRLALAMLHDSQAAEDAVQEASFTAWRKLGQMAVYGDGGGYSTSDWGVYYHNLVYAETNIFKDNGLA